MTSNQSVSEIEFSVFFSFNVSSASTLKGMNLRLNFSKKDLVKVND